MTFKFVLILLPAWAYCCGIASAQAPADASGHDRLAALIARLGHDEYAAREIAAQHIIAIGTPAIEALRAASDSENAEIRHRVARLLLILGRRDFQARLAAFAQNIDGDVQLKFPSWKKFSQVVGDSPRARKLFLAMLRAEPEILAAYAQDVPHAGRLADARAMDPLDGLSIGSVATVLLIAGDAQKQCGRPIAQFVTNAFNQQSVQAAMVGQDKQLMHKLVARWIALPAGNDWAIRLNKMWIAVRYNIKEGVEHAVDLVKDKDARPPFGMISVMAIAKLGDRGHAHVLEPLLKESKVHSETMVNGKKIQIQNRDIALAALLHLTSQNLADYGLKHARESGDWLYDMQSLYFENAAAREQALARWHAWSKVHLSQKRSAN